MIKNVLTHIGGVGAYGVISILIFISVFIGVAIWMLSMKKSYYHTMQSLPLADGEVAREIPPRISELSQNTSRASSTL
ncbi:MAG TPA: cbb3-type cytochrome c oxidase subunit 3 [Verrucomicrobiae bacterium]|nr:cbb3-type cytochrome c oxidase subunit 3 [Verrucomicrobiae bacterium]